MGSHLLTLLARKGVGDFYINLRLSSKVFAKMSDENQLLLRLNMVGGLQTL